MKRLIVFLIVCFMLVNSFYSGLSLANGNQPPNNPQNTNNGQTNNQPTNGSEHSNRGTTNEANRERHENGQSRKNRDQSSQGERGDQRRVRSNQRRGGPQSGQQAQQTQISKQEKRRLKRLQDQANKAKRKAQRQAASNAGTIVKKAKKLKRFCKGPLRPLGWCLLILTLPSEVRAHGVGGTIARNTPLLGEAIEIDECIIEEYDEYRKNKVRERIRISRSKCEQIIQENNLQPVEDQGFDEQYFNEFLRGIKHSMENERKNNTQQHVSPKPRGHMSVTPARATDNVVLERYDDFEGDRRMNLDINKDISTSSSNIRVNNTAFENTETYMKYDVGTRYNSNSEISVNSYESAVNNNMNGLETQTQTSYPVYNEYDSSYTDKQVNVESIRKFKESYNK